ncbi:hypothetical protein JCM19233_3218 [Vibrio astriarenae]|nr:hypothetical protein JCM19233_3218 [Vibrio sp. C7]
MASDVMLPVTEPVTEGDTSTADPNGVIPPLSQVPHDFLLKEGLMVRLLPGLKSNLPMIIKT